MKELLGYDLTIPEEMSIIRGKDLFHTTCPQMIADATEIVEQMLPENG